MTMNQKRWKGADRPAVCAMMVISMLLAITGCSKEPELMLASRCVKAGMVLEDPVLERASMPRATELGVAAHLKERDLLALNEELNNQLGHASVEQYFRTAMQWRDSDYCQKAVSELKAEMAATVAPLLAPAAPDAQGNVSCTAFVERAVAWADPAMKSYRNELRASLQKTVEGTVAVALKDFQAQSLEQRLKGTGIFDDLRQQCTAKGGTLNAALLQMQEVRKATSPTTQALVQRLGAIAQQFDCGVHRPLWCESKLEQEAVKEVIALSQQCDAAPKDASDCPVPSDQLVAQHLRSWKVRELEKHRELVLAAMQGHPAAGLDIDPRAQQAHAYQDCQREAINQGLRGEDYQRFKNAVCPGRAEAARLVPLQERLQEVDELLSQLRGS